MNDNNNATQTPVLPTDETGGVLVECLIKIFDPQTDDVYLEERA